jgi:class 3 adenylate cyclase
VISLVKRPSRATWRGALIGAACGLVAWLFALTPFGRGSEDWLQDANFAYRGARESATRIVIVGLDDDSLEKLPKPMAAASPELAEVVAYLHDRGAKVIGLDVFVPETLDGYDRAPGLGGARLGLAAARAGNVILPAARGDGGRLVRPLTSWQTTGNFGLVEVEEDLDHFVRRQRLAEPVGGENYDRLALALLDADGRADLAGDAIRVDGRPVPLDRQDCLRINFVGPPGTIPTVSFHRVLGAARGGAKVLVDQHERPVDLGGAVVMVGATARSLGDWHATPYANGSWHLPRMPRYGLMAGPEVQANVVATMADGAYITTPWWLMTMPWVLGLGAALGAVFARLDLSRGAAVALAHHFGWKGLALAAFASGHYRVEIMAMTLAGGLAYASTFALRWRVLRRMFGAVKSEAIARALEDDPGHLRLKGEERVVTVLFSDIRDFTSFSERHAEDPGAVVALLNAYFGAVVPAIEAEGGVVDKYIGDGIMALFGAPDDLPDHALRATRAAAAMVARVHELAPEWSRLGFDGMRIGVGIHTGPAVVGTIGSPSRLDYTAIGDTVNAAARIESANKNRKTEILLSAATHDDLPPDERSRLGSRPVEPVPLKGKSHPLELFQVPVPVNKECPNSVDPTPAPG